MPRIQLKGDGRKARAPKETLGRLLSYMAPYKWTLALVLVCILVTSVATVAGSKSLQYVVDDYIRPLLQMDAPDLGPLFRFLCIMAAVYVAGILSSFLYNYLMVQVAQGVQRDIRDQLFSNMQRLPIRYFDTHTHGDLAFRRCFPSSVWIDAKAHYGDNELACRKGEPQSVNSPQCRHCQSGGDYHRKAPENGDKVCGSGYPHS